MFHNQNDEECFYFSACDGYVGSGRMVYVLNNFWADACFQESDKSNFLIIFHFTLCASIADITADIGKEETREGIADGTITKLPYRFYKPVLWAITGVISLVGDIILLAAGSLVYQLSLSNGDLCTNSRIAHIVIDVVALSITIVSILWFIIFSFYYIKHKKDYLIDSGMVT